MKVYHIEVGYGRQVFDGLLRTGVLALRARVPYLIPALDPNSSVHHIPDSPAAFLRPDLIAICSGNHAAAIVLSVFDAIGDGWHPLTSDCIRESILGMYARANIRRALGYLERLGFIESLKHPEDPTLHRRIYRYNAESVAKAVDAAGYAGCEKPDVHVRWEDFPGHAKHIKCRNNKKYKRLTTKEILAERNGGWSCFYCRRKGTSLVDPDGERWHADHRIPRSRGGSNDMEDLLQHIAFEADLRNCFSESDAQLEGSDDRTW